MATSDQMTSWYMWAAAKARTKRVARCRSCAQRGAWVLGNARRPEEQDGMLAQGQDWANEGQPVVGVWPSV